MTFYFIVKIVVFCLISAQMTDNNSNTITGSRERIHRNEEIQKLNLNLNNEPND
jgi:hypothetical protein